MTSPTNHKKENTIATPKDLTTWEKRQSSTLPSGMAPAMVSHIRGTIEDNVDTSGPERGSVSEK